MNTTGNPFDTFVTEGEWLNGRAAVAGSPRWLYVRQLESFVTSSHAPGRLCVSPLRVYEVGWTYLTPDLLSGYSIRQECSGDHSLVGLFSFVRGRGDALVAQAVRRGANVLECYDVVALTSLYERHGFRVVERFPFDPTLAPKGFGGAPDYLTMRRGAP